MSVYEKFRSLLADYTEYLMHFSTRASGNSVILSKRRYEEGFEGEERQTLINRSFSWFSLVLARCPFSSSLCPLSHFPSLLSLCIPTLVPVFYNDLSLFRFFYTISLNIFNCVSVFLSVNLFLCLSVSHSSRNPPSLFFPSLLARYSTVNNSSDVQN